uniref:General transcription and DNA repair factor IIH helicase/translocase subunit XPB n=1 Tax=Dermatophagoides pteronyssinus TaxID=6956 RepID=A0A6P6Y5Y4_DERPT
GKPLLTEYDALNDTTSPTLHIELRQTTKLRYYQKRALSRIFHNGRARSGIVVLPCGAGKTLLGIAACALIKKSTIILTSNSVSVEQWRVSLLQFSTVDPAQIVVLTSDAKSRLPDGPCIVCTTYTMISFSGQRSELAEEATNQIRARDWGLLIFDEVQFAPAPAFRRVTEQCRSHCKIGLTATLVREDNLIDDLHWMVGPKLDEANWQELQKNGFLARAKCSEVWCPMTLEFYRAFNHTVLRKLWTCNPNKLRACEYLIQFHEARGDKVIVFSDYLMALKVMAVSLKRPFISGDVPTAERVFILNKFKTDPSEKTIFLSKVGDNAIDIPCANVVIQISFNYASRRQETQRLGRILRPKPGLQQHSQYNAFFYSLASQDTPEIIYADKRQQYLIDQGYAYQIISLNKLPLEKANLVFSDPEKQKELLHSILISADSDDGSDVEVSTTYATESVL